MTITNTGVGSIKTLTVTPWTNEQSISAGTNPPASMTSGSPQATYTFNKNTMTPTFGGTALMGIKSYSTLWGGALCGKNTSGAAVATNWQINKNGTLWKSGNTSLANNNNYAVVWYDVPNDGDVYDVYLWAGSQTGMDYTYQLAWGVPIWIDLGVKTMANLSMVLSTPYSLFKMFTVNNNFTAATLFYPLPPTNNSCTVSTVGTYNFSYYTTHPTFKLYGTNASITGTATMNFSSTAFAQIQSSMYPSLISFREVR
jgi:hypothetical protein